jgi:hypothetical protein
MPAQIAHRWLSVGNPEKLSAAIRPRDAPQWAAGCPHEELAGLFLRLGRTRGSLGEACDRQRKQG